MTVCYSSEVATARPFGFVRLLFRWRGSFWKLIFFQFGVYFFIYNLLNCIYMFVLNNDQRKQFDEYGCHIGRISGSLVGPVVFCLGFFIQQVYKRFCDHFLEIPWPDALAFLISAYVRGYDTKSRALRRTMVRYGVASVVLTLMSISERMQALFPNLDLVVVSGFLTEGEAALLEEVKPSSRHMIVLSWCAALFRKARVAGVIEDEFGYNDMINELDNIRFKCRRLILYDWVSVPLAYTHTVLLGLNSLFTAAAIGGINRVKFSDERFDTTKSGDDWMVRLLAEGITLLHFSICAGMLAASHALIRPFGKNDGNIDVDQIVKRHLSIAYIIVDDLFAVIPVVDPADLLFNPTAVRQRSMNDLALSNLEIEIYKNRRKTRASIFSLHRTSMELAELRDIGIVFEVGDTGLNPRWRWLRRLPFVNRFLPPVEQSSTESADADATNSNNAYNSDNVTASVESIPLSMTVGATTEIRNFQVENREVLQRILSYRRLLVQQ